MAVVAPRSVSHADWHVLRAVAHQLHGRLGLDAHDADRTAIRLGNYIRTEVLEITIIDDVFGLSAATAWMMIDFKDGLEQICVPFVVPPLRVAAIP